MTDSKKKIVLKKLKEHDTIWHPDSTLVFKSQKERLVIGRYVDEELIPLDETALDLCEEWKFKPDESLLEDGGEGEEEEEAGEEEKEAREEETQTPPVDDAEDKEAREEETQTPPVDDAEEEEEEVEVPIPVVKELPKKEVKKELPKKSPLKNSKEECGGDKLEIDTGVLYAETSAHIGEILSGMKSVFEEAVGPALSGYTKKLEEVETKYNVKVSELSAELASKTEEYTELKKQYDAIKVKFDTMKSLFN